MKKVWQRIYRRYLLDALSAMGQGLFASLIIGLILGQLGRIPGLGFLATFTTRRIYIRQRHARGRRGDRRRDSVWPQGTSAVHIRVRGVGRDRLYPGRTGRRIPGGRVRSRSRRLRRGQDARGHYSHSRDYDNRRRRGVHAVRTRHKLSHGRAARVHRLGYAAQPDTDGHNRVGGRRPCADRADIVGGVVRNDIHRTRRRDRRAGPDAGGWRRDSRLLRTDGRLCRDQFPREWLGRTDLAGPGHQHDPDLQHTRSPRNTHTPYAGLGDNRPRCARRCSK